MVLRTVTLIQRLLEYALREDYHVTSEEIIKAAYNLQNDVKRASSGIAQARLEAFDTTANEYVTLIIGLFSDGIVHIMHTR
jgi:hypothetical protein